MDNRNYWTIRTGIKLRITELHKLMNGIGNAPFDMRMEISKVEAEVLQKTIFSDIKLLNKRLEKDFKRSVGFEA